MVYWYGSRSCRGKIIGGKALAPAGTAGGKSVGGKLITGGKAKTAFGTAYRKSVGGISSLQSEIASCGRKSGGGK